MKNLKILLACLLLLVMVYRSDVATACGPFLSPYLLHLSQRPDSPLERFARGGLGVLQPTYWRIYLVPAYRQLIGRGFDAEEEKVLIGIWEASRKPWHKPPGEEARDFWMEQSRKVRGHLPPPRLPGLYRQFSGEGLYGEYLNCPEDAFRTAAQTLADRVRTYGSDSSKVKAWVKAQDEVFANCTGGRMIPQGIDSTDPRAVADRNYQIAAAHFYSEDFDAAQIRFDAIAHDNSSPWREIAPYLAARALVRKGTLSAEYRKIDAAPMAEAERRLNAILADSHQSAIHPASVRLLSFVRFRLHPEAHLEELASALLQQGSAEALDPALMDYTNLMMRHQPEHPDDMTDWVLTVRAQGSSSLDHTLAKWQEKASPAWLVAAMMKMTPGHPRSAALSSAATKLRPDSPAFVEATYHRLRLEVEAGKTDAARRDIDDFLAEHGKSLTVSPRNLFLDLRLKVARNLGEFTKYAQLEIAGWFYGEPNIESPLLSRQRPWEPQVNSLTLSNAAADAMNKYMPLSTLVRVAEYEGFAANIRSDLAQAVWTRAALLDRPDVARQIQPALVQHYPELKNLAEAADAAPSPQERRFARVYLMLRSPGLRPYVSSAFRRTTPIDQLDDYRENWWCGLRSDTTLDCPVYFRRYDKRGDEERSRTDTEYRSPEAGFLTAQEQKAAQEEWAQLASVPTAPNYLAQQVLTWARKHPKDPRVPESLHRVVRASRLGCTDAETTKYSKAAFQFLHRHYPDSVWAKKTKYWY